MCNYKCTPVLNITHHNNVHFESCVILYCRLFSVYPLSNHIPIMGSNQCYNVSAFCVGNKRYCAIIVLHLPIIPQVSVFLSECDSVCLSHFRFPTVNFKLDQCVAQNLTMCLLYLSVYGCCQLIELNDFLVVCAVTLLAHDAGRS